MELTISKYREEDALKLLRRPKSRLEVLDLSHNHIEDAGASILAEVLPEHGALRSLDLAHNLITAVGGARFAAALPLGVGLGIGLRGDGLEC